MAPTQRCVALLRGINVGTAKRVAMADLKKLFEGLGYDDVRPLLNSGNVVFTAPTQAAGAADRIERAIAAKLGVATRVTVLTGRELTDAIRDNPFASIASDPSRLLIMVLRDAKARARLTPLLDRRWAPEALALGKRAAYVWCPKGSVAGELWEAANRAVGDQGTSRNLATMTKLMALVEGAAIPSPRKRARAPAAGRRPRPSR